MKSKFQISVAVACLAILTACGGGSKKSDPVVVPQPAYAVKDVTVGVGTDSSTLAEKGDLVAVAYTGYLYDSTKADGIGAKVESSIDTNTTAPPFTLGVGGVVPNGWDLAIAGMRVGGVRLATLPANLAYGDLSRLAQTVAGYSYAAMPANSPLVYELRLVNVTKLVKQPSVPAPTDLKIVEVTAGTGAVAANGKSVTVRYTGWLYDGTRDNFKGTRFDPATPGDTAYSTTTFTIGDGTMVSGFNTGTQNMQVGGKRTVFIPPALGYGATGKGSVPPNANMVFDIELMSVN
ncbi:FKBP-type peptidyl-prolyl cis-trans isomerase [Duganella sp. 1411]|uniref:FKBP-type peptidyl-prolyl cis-trans isomerase n=1 Tax=Duganella sp. 1411 TaxID=2806572 RepID=UPI001AE0EA67|nr:FKBP-type peptidyl-prolyl cis-trans isomerase [Duganella sp. 1411]